MNIPAVIGLAESIRAAGTLSATRLYDVMQSSLTPAEFDSCLRALVTSGSVHRDGDTLRWIA